MTLFGEQYVHTLIAEESDLAPNPHQVASFFDHLTILGGLPPHAELFVRKGQGKLRTGTHPLTGETITMRARFSECVSLNSTIQIPRAIAGLEHYDVRMSGKGPPNVPPFLLWRHDSHRSAADDVRTLVPVDPQMPYSLDVACCLRAQSVSTSCWEDNNSPHTPLPFGEACTLEDRTGFFPRPPDGALITVPNAGSARFWIEFEFGKWIFPKVETSFDVLDPRILGCAEQAFGSKFVQGCHWL